MANKEEALARLIEITTESLWFIASQDFSRDEAIKVRGEISKPLGVLVSKNGLSVENNLRHKLQRANKKKGENNEQNRS